MTKKKHQKRWQKEETPLDFSPLPDYGDLMSMDEFKERCEKGLFINYDGIGYLSDGKNKSNIMIRPSEVKSGKLFPDWATHVIWFNR